MGQGKAGWWIVGAAAAIVLISVGYGLGHRKNTDAMNASQALTPVGAPLSSIQIEPIQPQQELAAINSSPTATTTTQLDPAATTTTGNAMTDPSAAASSAGSPLPKEESARVREIQQALKSAGYDPGSVDGRMGARTRTAIRDFQLANGLEPDGKVGPRTWNKLEAFLNSSAGSSSSVSSSAASTKTAKASND